MEQFNAYLGEMTLWNWLTLIAFIFLPLSVLNAFLGLKTRYLDWRAQAGQKSFEERVRTLLLDYKVAERNDPVYAITTIAILLTITLVCSTFTILAFLLLIYTRLTLGGSLLELYLAGLAVSLAIIFIWSINKTVSEANKLSFSSRTVESLVKVLKTGLKNGFTIDVVTTLSPVLESPKWKDSFKTEIRMELEGLQKKYKERAGLTDQQVASTTDSIS